MEKQIIIRVRIPHRDASIRHYQGVATKQLRREHRFKSANSYGYEACEVDGEGVPYYLYRYGITE
jgi:hypothetical protein